MFPKSKTGLLRWARGNIGKKLQTRMYKRIYDKDDNFLGQKIVWDAGIREIDYVTSNRIQFEGGSSIYFNQQSTTYEFTESGFKVIEPMINIVMADGREVRTQHVLEYLYL